MFAAAAAPAAGPGGVLFCGGGGESVPRHVRGCRRSYSGAWRRVFFVGAAANPFLAMFAAAAAPTAGPGGVHFLWGRRRIVSPPCSRLPPLLQRDLAACFFVGAAANRFNAMFAAAAAPTTISGGVLFL
jgi:hypothetical protein